MKVAITGGAGFLGRSVAYAMDKSGIETYILDTSGRLESLQQDNQEFRTRILEYPNVQDAEALFADIDVIIHLACTTDPATSMQCMAYDATTNIVPSLELFNAAETAGVRRIVFASSGGTVYGRPVSLPVTEEHPTHPICAYGVSKLAIENYLGLYSQIEGISLRIGNPYGSYQLRGTAIGLIANFLNAIHTGRPIEVWGDGSIIRDYLYIDDLTDAFIVAATQPDLGSGFYNIGSGKGRCINEMITKIFAITNKSVPVNYTKLRGYDVPEIFLEIEKFKSRTGWEARTSLTDGILKLWKELH